LLENRGGARRKIVRWAKLKKIFKKNKILIILQKRRLGKQGPGPCQPPPDFPDSATT